MNIHLINMPFAYIYAPSIALTQLKSVLESRFGDKVTVTIHYFNHNFAEIIGKDLYSFFAQNPLSSYQGGCADWFFRQAAFPELADNSKEYLTRYGKLLGQEYLTAYNQSFKHIRDHLRESINKLITRGPLADAEIVGFTAMFFQTMANTAMARRLKEINPNIITIMGGASCEAGMGIEMVHHLRCFDFVFSGPALVSLPEFVNCVMEGDEEKCHRIDGVFSRRNTRSVSSAPGEAAAKTAEARLQGIAISGRELDINQDVALDYESFLKSFQTFFAGEKPVLLFETSRGCWWGQKSHCTFCGLNGLNMKYRAMQSERAIRLLQRLFERYGDKVSSFQSVDNVVSQSYFLEVLPQLRVPDQVALFYEVRADLDEGEMRTLARAHVWNPQPGIESLSSSTLRLMRKGTTAFTNIRFLRYAAQFGIRPGWNLLIGFPGEKADVYQNYIKKIPFWTHLCPPGGTTPVRFDRFSVYWLLAKDYSLDLQPLDYYALNYPFQDDVLRQMAYFFEDRNYSAEHVKNVAVAIRPLQDKVQYWRTRWEGKDGLLPAKLYMKNGGRSCIIHDSRLGTAREFEISDEEKTVLQALEQPMDLEILAKKLGQLQKHRIEECLFGLGERGLLFGEDGRWMSLVLPEETCKNV